jgi:hypothetical protein
LLGISHECFANNRISIDIIFVKLLIGLISRHKAVSFICVIVQIETAYSGKSFVIHCHYSLFNGNYLWNADYDWLCGGANGRDCTLTSSVLYLSSSAYLRSKSMASFWLQQLSNISQPSQNFKVYRKILPNSLATFLSFLWKLMQFSTLSTYSSASGMCLSSLAPLAFDAAMCYCNLHTKRWYALHKFTFTCEDGGVALMKDWTAGPAFLNHS